MPSYSVPFGRRVVPIMRDLHAYRDIYCAYRPNFKSLPHSTAVLEWIAERFSSRKYPWFEDDFVDPKTFDKLDILAMSATD